MTTFYRKTRIGQTEIETRALRLLPRLRSLLIIIDGRRDAAALQALLGYAPATALQELLGYGLIEAVAQHMLAPAAAGGNSVPSTPAATSDAAAFTALRKAAVRALNDALGPAGETLAIPMERSPTEAELRPLLQRAAALVGSVRGAAAGRAYAERFPGLA